MTLAHSRNLWSYDRNGNIDPSGTSLYCTHNKIFITLANMYFDKRKYFERNSRATYLSNRIASPCACISSTRLSAVALCDLCYYNYMYRDDIIYVVSVGKYRWGPLWEFVLLWNIPTLDALFLLNLFRGRFRARARVCARCVCMHHLSLLCWYTNYSFMFRTVFYTIIKFRLCQKWVNVNKTISCHN